MSTAETPQEPVHGSPQAPAATAPNVHERPIRFWHRGALRAVSGVHPTRSLLDWLREDAHCHGTKEGCNEGDCGACTVVLGERDASAPGGLRLDTVNACTRFLPTLDGRALFTVQDIATLNQAPNHGRGSPALHPVQQAMVDCHGSQCGFCTPGFIVSMWRAYEQGLASGERPTRQAMADELAGNLCRCTGYQPILDAAERMFDLPAVQLDRAPVVQALEQLARCPPLRYTAKNPQQRDAAGEPRHDTYEAPRTLEALARLVEAQPQSRLLAGATDIGLWVNKQFRDLGNIIYLGDVAELQQVRREPGHWVIGAGASLEAAWQALATTWPSLAEVWLRFASPPVRRAGTMGGNVANGSPIGDSAPVLMALGASLLLRRGDRLRQLPLADFYTGYQRNRLEAGEFVQAICVPLPDPALPAEHALQVRAYKVSKRFDSDISGLCAGMAIQLEAGGKVAQVRLAFGGMAATVSRATNAEAALIGKAWDTAALESACAAIAQDYNPITDLRASDRYRRQVAQNLLRRFWMETRPDQPLAPEALSVWPQRLAAAGSASRSALTAAVRTSWPG